LNLNLNFDFSLPKRILGVRFGNIKSKDLILYGQTSYDAELLYQKPLFEKINQWETFDFTPHNRF